MTTSHRFFTPIASKAGRRMVNIKGGEFYPHQQSQEVRDWNARVDAEKQAKLEAKLNPPNPDGGRPVKPHRSGSGDNRG